MRCTQSAPAPRERPEPIPERPNILLIVVDCLRADHADEGSPAHIPAIRRLRTEGFSFGQAIACTTTTTPSFAGMLTGRYPIENGVRSHAGYALAEALPTLPDVMRQQGYHTYAEVTGPLGPEVGLSRGFERYSFRDRRESIHRAWGKDFLERFPADMQEPWFLLLHIWALHWRRQVLPQCETRTCGTTLYARAVSSIDVCLAQLREKVPQNTITILTGDHGEDVPSTDLQGKVSRFRRKLYRFATKHGLTRKHMSHGLRGIRDGHGYSLYDELVRVPLTFHAPGLIAPGLSDLQVRHIDMLPTAMEIAGLKPPDGVTGRSALGIVRGHDSAHRDAFIEAVGSTLPDEEEWLAGIRVDARYKYVYAPHLTDFAPELYDLAQDRGERSNIAADLPEVAADLRQRIERIQASAVAGAAMSRQEHAAVMNRLADLGYVDGV